jgi:hypothetical protein
MVARIIALFISGLCVWLMVWLGELSDKKSSYVPIFGIVCALAGPIALAGFERSLRGKKKEEAEKFLALDEIEKRIQEAKTREQRIKVLQDEQKKLQQIIVTEARLQALESRKSLAIEQAKKVLDELDIIEAEFVNLHQPNSYPAITDAGLRRLRDQIAGEMKGQIVFHIGTRPVILTEDVLMFLPFSSALWWLLINANKLMRTKSPTKTVSNGTPPTAGA